jgi:hypothetical protein
MKLQIGDPVVISDFMGVTASNKRGVVAGVPRCRHCDDGYNYIVKFDDGRKVRFNRDILIVDTE